MPVQGYKTISVPIPFEIHPISLLRIKSFKKVVCFGTTQTLGKRSDRMATVLQDGGESLRVLEQAVSVNLSAPSILIQRDIDPKAV